eukprot:1085079-Amphidinium_carterae.1
MEDTDAYNGAKAANVLTNGTDEVTTISKGNSNSQYTNNKEQQSMNGTPRIMCYNMNSNCS